MYYINDYNNFYLGIKLLYMNITHEKQLYNIGKRLYIKRKENNKSSCMTFGFTCGDGWFEPIKKLTISLEKINDELKSYKSDRKSVV